MSAPAFFRDHWVERTPDASNIGGRLRVNDRDASVHKWWGKRSEGLSNGLMLADFPEDLFELSGAELYLELWGGHPGTLSKRFTVNGYGNYALPEVGTADKHCTYSYPTVPIEVRDLVAGTNAIQFTCERGTTFWGHYIIDNACLRAYLKPSHPDLDSDGLGAFEAIVMVDNADAIADSQRVAIEYPAAFEQRIARVEYYACYRGFDDRGSGGGRGWHGFTYKREPMNHVGTAVEPPFFVTWDTRLIPTQDTAVALVAVVRLRSGISYRTTVLGGLHFASSRPPVRLHYCDTIQPHFWSRDKHAKKATITLSADELAGAAEIVLVTKVWDGGAGTVEEPFTINGHAYDIISGTAIHDVVFTRTKVDPTHLVAGENILRLYSDTEHHGVEMLLPGPGLIIRQNAAADSAAAATRTAASSSHSSR